MYTHRAATYNKIRARALRGCRTAAKARIRSLCPLSPRDPNRLPRPRCSGRRPRPRRAVTRPGRRNIRPPRSAPWRIHVVTTVDVLPSIRRRTHRRFSGPPFTAHHHHHHHCRRHRYHYHYHLCRRRRRRRRDSDTSVAR